MATSCDKMYACLGKPKAKNLQQNNVTNCNFNINWQTVESRQHSW